MYSPENTFLSTTLPTIPVMAEVAYDDASHRYFRGNITYTSATQLIDLFKPVFNTEERSEYMVYRYGMTKQYWKDKWNGIRDTALERGTRIHNFREDYLHNRGFDRIHGKTFQVHNLEQFHAHGYNIPYHMLQDGVYPELKLWDHNWQIAGRADKIALEQVRSGREMHVEDYKTGRIIHSRGWDNRNGTFQMMLDPISHLEDCELTHYSLQLSLYQFMGEYFGFKPGKRRIIHFHHEIEDIGTPPPTVTELPYLRDEVISMLKHKSRVA